MILCVSTPLIFENPGSFESDFINPENPFEELNKYTKLNSLKVLNYFPDKEYTYNKDLQNLQTAGCMVC